jgi:hypothetical protein
LVTLFICLGIILPLQKVPVLKKLIGWSFRVLEEQPTDLNSNRISMEKPNELKCIGFFNRLTRKWWKWKRGGCSFLAN